MTDSQRDEILNKLGDIDPALAESFSKSSDPDKWLKEADLEGYSEFTDNYESLDDFIGDRDKILAKLYQNMDGKIPSGARMQSFREKHPEISEEDIVSWFNKTNEYKKQYEQEREDEAGRIRRSREVREEWVPWKNPLTWLGASEYERERYIRDPESAIFGKESDINLSNIHQKGEAISDLAYGSAGAVGDLIPGAGGLLGPTARAARDVQHVASDSKYQKGVGSMTGSAIADYVLSLGAWKIANARKAARMEGTGRDPMVQHVLDAEKMKKNVAEGINKFDEKMPYTQTEWNKLLESIPDSPLKRDLMAANASMASPVERAAIVSNYEKQLQYATPELARAAIDTDFLLRNSNPSLKNMPKNSAQSELIQTIAKVEPLSNRQKIGLLAAKAIEQYNKRAPGQIAVQTLSTASGKKSGDLEDKYKSYDFNTAKAWYKKEYKRDFDLGFVPREGDDPAKIAAYEEYLKEKNK